VALSLLAAGYRYAAGRGVGPVDLGVGPGERVLLAGASGSGKSTLLRLAAGLLHRHGWGTTSGAVRVDDADPAALAPAERPGRLAFVAQDPGDQLVCGTVADEVAFGPECAGWPADRVTARIPAVLAEVGLDGLDARDPRTLSTGQQQRLVTGAALAAGARVLLLDEPLAHLDPDGAAALLARLRDLADAGVAVVLAEHRLDAVRPWATRMVVLRDGALVHDGPPVDVPELADPPADPPVARLGDVVLDATIRHAYGDRVVLDGVHLTLRAGERVALLGANGAGKSTLLGRLSGRLGEPVAADVLEVPQDPDLTLFCATVREELAYGPTDRRQPGDRVTAVADAMRLAPLLDRPPHALSRGERLRVAVGAALTCAPRVLLLDEPTAGQDRPAVEATLRAVHAALPDGAVLFATHDLALARRHATRVLTLREGRIHG
jgi:energy-coupling factor transport system ATP-binding protein